MYIENFVSCFRKASLQLQVRNGNRIGLNYLPRFRIQSIYKNWTQSH